MAFWGLLFIAIGVGALLDIRIWPLVLVVVGIAMLRPVLSGGRRYRNQYDMWWCWWGPSTWEGSREGRSVGPQSAPGGKSGQGAGPPEVVAAEEERAWM